MTKRLSIPEIQESLNFVLAYVKKAKEGLKAVEKAPDVGKRINRDKEIAVIEAALKWAYCPSAGGYMDGPAVEDTCEDLSEAVRQLVGIDPHVLDDNFAKRCPATERYWPTIAEVNAELAKKTKFRIPE